MTNKPDRQALMAAKEALRDMVAAIEALPDETRLTIGNFGASTTTATAGDLRRLLALAEAAPAGTGTEVGELIEQVSALGVAAQTLSFVDFHTEEAALTYATFVADLRAFLPTTALALEALTRERNGLQDVNTISDRIVGELNTEVMALEDTIAELRAQLDARPTTASGEILEDALHDIVRWADAYPLAVFQEPDIAKAHELLKAGGMTLDAISASNIRHVVTGVGKIARKALARAALALPRSPASPEPEKGK